MTQQYTGAHHAGKTLEQVAKAGLAAYLNRK